MKLLEGLPEIGSLTEGQEKSLVRRGHLKKLILANMREAWLYAKACSNGGFGDDELLSLCYLALSSSAKRYKIKRNGIGFFSFAKVRIRGMIAREWKNKNTVRNAHKINRGTAGETVNFVTNDRGEANFQQIFDDQGLSQLPDIDSIQLKDQWALLEPVMKSCLDNREIAIIKMHYDEGLSFPEISALKKITRQAVHRTHGKALEKLRKRLLHRKEQFDI